MAHASNSSAEKAEAGGWPVRGQPDLHSKILCQKNKMKEKKKGGRGSEGGWRDGGRRDREMEGEEREGMRERGEMEGEWKQEMKEMRPYLKGSETVTKF